jgi:uncharacterized protein YigE (DUF2233 family)
VNAKVFVKTALLSAVFMTALLAFSSALAKTTTAACATSRSTSFEVHRCDHDRLWIIETRKLLVPIYHAVNALTLRQLGLARGGEFVLLVNGSYHDGDYANAQHEGLFVVNGKAHAPLKALDKQLSHVVNINEAGAIVAITPAEENSTPANRWKDGTHIQTGPLVVDAGHIATAFIDAAINGKDRYKRSALGVTSDGATIIVIAKTPRTLHDLANAVLNVNHYRRRKLTLVNLDGGPSTALHSTEQPQLSYGADKVTPIVFGVRR